MSYEYPFDDDREVTVGDLRILQQSVVYMLIAGVAFMFFSLGIILDTLGEPLSGLYWIGAGLFFLAFVWVNVKDGYLRKFVGFFWKFDSPALEGSKFGHRNERVRGDD